MGTYYKGKKEDKLALDTWIKLARASNSVFNKIKPSMTKYGLSTTQFAVLEVLLHLGPMPQSIIGNKLLRTSGNIIKVIDNLERSDLVVRTPADKDRRIHIIKLTKKGKDLITLIFEQHVNTVFETFSVLTEIEKKELSRICKKLGNN